MLSSAEAGAEHYPSDRPVLVPVAVAASILVDFFELPGEVSDTLSRRVRDVLQRAVVSAQVAVEQVRSSNDPRGYTLIRERTKGLLNSVAEVIRTAQAAAPRVEDLNALTPRVLDGQLRFQLNEQLSDLVSEARGARDAAVAHAAEAGEAAADVGATELSRYFGRYAAGEKTAADWLRVACVLVLLLLAGASAAVVRQTTSFRAGELAKLAVGIPLGLLAAYLARESSAHREAHQWAMGLSIQLQTIRAYTADLPAASRVEIQAEFGKRIFGEPPRRFKKGDDGGLIDSASIDLLDKIDRIMHGPPATGRGGDRWRGWRGPTAGEDQIGRRLGGSDEPAAG